MKGIMMLELIATLAVLTVVVLAMPQKRAPVRVAAQARRRR